MTTWQEEFRTAIAGRYDIQYELARGGMAAVFLARDLRHARNVAVKVVLPDIATAVAADRFAREITIAASLAHPHILPLLDSGHDGGFLYYVMPYVEGETLRDRLVREHQLPIDDTLQIVHDVSSALAYAHSRGVIHRDIKPENILLSAGVAVVADFGIARAMGATTDPGEESGSGTSHLTQAGLVVGTPAYMSPEQAGGTEVDARSDVYSLASVVYEMLGGTLPFGGTTPQAVYASQLAGPPGPVALHRAGLSPQFDRVLRKALAPTPADRFQTATQFNEAVRACTTSTDLPTRTTDPVAGSDRTSTAGAHIREQAVRWKRLAGPVLAVAATVGIGWAGLQLGSARPATGGPPTDLAIFPFRTNPADASTLGEGLADLTAAAIDGTVGIDVADPESLWRSLRADDGTGLRIPDLDAAGEMARRRRARHFVLGSVTTLEDRVEISARVYDPDATPIETVRVNAPKDSLSSAIDRVAIGVVRAVWNGTADPAVPSTGTTATTSIEALQAYLDARSRQTRGDYEGALAAIERAVTLDSTFALAHLAHFQIRSWILFQDGQPFTGLTPIIDQAMAYRDRLPPRDRYRVEGYKALDRTDGRRAATSFERILAIDPEDLDARLSLAFTYLVYGWQMDKDIGDIADAVRRVLALDSTSIWGRATLTRLAVIDGDTTLARDQAAALSSQDSTSAFVGSTIASARLLTGDSAEITRRLRTVAEEPIPVVTTVLRDLRNSRPSVALRFAQILADRGRPERHRQTGMGALAQLRIGVGQVRRADSTVRAGLYERIRPVLNRYFVTSALAEAGVPEATARAVRELEAFAPADSLTAFLYTRPAVWATGWAVGAWQATFGDTTAARRWQQALTALPGGNTEWAWREALTEDIEARLAVRRGDFDNALTSAQTAYDDWAIHSANVLESDPEPAMRFHLAELLQRAGRLVEAERLYLSFVPPYNWAGFYTARSALALGDLAAGRAAWEDAARYYALAVTMWRAGDAEVAGWGALAEQGLQRVLAESR